MIGSSALSGRVLVRQFEQPLAAPDSDDTHVLRVTAVDDAKRWSDQFTKKRLVELRDHTAHVWMFGEHLDACEDLVEQALSDIRRALLDVPGMQSLQVGQSGLGNPDDSLRHGLLQVEPRLGVCEGEVATRLEVRKPCNDRSHERPLLLGRLVVSH